VLTFFQNLFHACQLLDLFLQVGMFCDGTQDDSLLGGVIGRLAPLMYKRAENLIVLTEI